MFNTDVNLNSIGIEMATTVSNYMQRVRDTIQGREYMIPKPKHTHHSP